MSRQVLFILLCLSYSVASSESHDLMNIITDLEHDLLYMNHLGTSDKCIEQTEIFRSGLSMDNPSPESLRMLDATGKLPSGIAQGNKYSIGSYEECVAVLFDKDVQEAFRGKYCKGGIRARVENKGDQKSDPISPHFPTFKTIEQFGDINVALKTLLSTYDETKEDGNLEDSLIQIVYGGLTWAACIPEACTADELKNSTDEAINDALANLPPLEFGGQKVIFYSQFDDKDCFLDHQDIVYDTLDIIYIAIMSVMAICVAGATCKDLVQRYSSFWLGGGSETFSTDEEGTLGRVLGAFSVYRNGTTLFSTKQSSKSIRCLHGMRFFSMSWVIFGHGLFPLFSDNTSMNFSTIDQISKRPELQVGFNAYPSVDTFLFLSGFLLAYSLLSELDRGTKNILLVYPNMLVHRYLRLTPAYLAVIGFFATINNKVFLFGPNDRNSHDEACRKYWWQMILYIHTFFDGSTQNIYDSPGNKYPEEHGMCMPQSWYLSLDMQIFVAAVPLIMIVWLFITKGYRVAAIITGGTVTLAALITPGVLTMIYHFAPTDIIQDERPGVTQSQHEIIYKKPWCRAMPYLVGIWLAFWMWSRKDKKPLVLSRFAVAWGWLLAATCALLVQYGMYPYNQPGPATWNDYEAFFYSTFHRPVWALCLSWVLVACHSGYGGPINSFLGWSAFVPLSKLTYSSYLVHFIPMLLFWNNARAMHKDLLFMSWIHIANVVVSMAFAVFLTLLIEVPTTNLDKMLLGRQPQKKEVKQALEKA